MSRNTGALLLLVFVSCLSPVSQAQAIDQRDLYRFGLESDETTFGTDVDTPATFQLLFRDFSKDSTGAISPAPGTPNVGTSQHSVSFTYTPLGQDVAGWAVIPPSPLFSKGGETHELTMTVTPSKLATYPYFPFTLTARVSAPGGPYFTHINLTVFTLGIPSFNAQAGDVGGEIKPGDIVQVPIRITNGALMPRGFDIELVGNSCDLLAVASTNNLVQAKSTETYTISVRGPTNRPWFFSETCTLDVKVNPSDAPSAARVITAPIVVNGGYLNPQWVIWAVEILVVLLLLLFLLKRRKERVEEELLGKPQKPWTIPVEALYLRALRQKDERAWYVVRHHLMEEEYRSALLWYKSYKKATKGNRRKEALVLRQEKAYERWKAKWQKDIEKPLRKADRFEAKLQKKLDRKARKMDRKDERSVRKLTKKMAAAHAKKVERELEKWQKQARKAQKKGLAAPPRPVVPEPDYPDEPEPRQIQLADHKWSKKAARFRARRVKQQGNLEVKFEKADARRLAKLRRKVQRLARKLDDPDFVAEHPLLRADA